MKKRITLLAILQVFIFTGLCNSQIAFNKFYLGTFTFPNLNSYHNSYFFNKYDSLMYNLMVGYIGHFDYDPGCGSYGKIWGGFYDEINSSGYTTSLYPTIDNFNNHYQNKGGFSLFLEREKILRPAYGQSSRHEAEYDPAELENGTIRPAYGFKTVYGATYQDPDGTKGRVLYANGTPGYFVKGMYENLEQVNVITDMNNSSNRDLWYNMGDRKDADHYWFIKPRIRIDSAFAANNLYTPVVAVIIKDYNGVRTDSIILTCRNFGKLENGVLKYDGSYIDRFYIDLPTNPPFYINKRSYDLGIPTNKCTPDASILDDCKMDYQIYWYGSVTTWLDCIKIEDSWGHALLTDTLLLINDNFKFRDKIIKEVSLFQNKYGTVPKFYVDEFNYNMIPCIHFVDSLVKAASKNQSSGVVCLLNDFWTREKCGGLRKGPKYSDNYSYLFKPGTTDNVLLTEIYPFDAILPLPTSIPTLPNISRYPQTFGYHYASSNNVYNDSLHLNLETGLIYPEDNTHPGRIPSFMDRFRKCSNEIKQANKFSSFIVSVPFHTEENPYYDAKMREPTVEEMSLMSYLSMAYGANGVLQFSFNSKEKYDVALQQYYYYWGIENLEIANGGCDNVSNNRNINYYGQPKYAYILKLDTALRKIGDFMYDVTKGKLIYDDTRTINTKFGNPNDATLWGLPFKYINDIKSIPYDQPAQGYSEGNPDPSDKRYWELGFFNPRTSETNDKSKYLLAVNKRCAPINEYISITDKRLLKIKFDASQLAGFNNWVIKDAITDSTINTFNKNSGSYVRAGEFMPAEGRLLKFAPVMQEGGTLVCDEVVAANQTFACNGMVFNNGKSITINTGTTINFKSDSAGIQMYGGSFLSGLSALDGPPRVVFQGLNNALWKGIQLQNCPTVTITYTDFKNVKYDSAASYNNALSMINCANFFISKCNFTLDTKAGGINMFFNFDNVKWEDYLVSYNNFTIPSGNANEPKPIGITSVGAGVMPIRIDGNAFTNSSGYSAPLAVFLSGVTGGSVKNNTITGFVCSVNSSSSSVDFYGNTIYNNGSNSIGLYGNAGGTMYLSPNYTNYTGGGNNISSLGTNGINLKSENTYFYTDIGYNVFNISTPGTNNSYHYYGYFPSGASRRQQAKYNCYQENSTATTTPTNMVTAGDGGGQISFIFNPRTCEPIGGAGTDFIVYSSPGVINDTVIVKYNGSGGGLSENGKIMDAAQSDYRNLLDSININLRKRLYSSVETQAHNFLNHYIDSTESLDAVAKLYFVTTILDSAGNKMNPLKSYFENIIANNPDNTALLSRVFYFVQKCKVALKQYSSAMQGFQLIIQQNPYSYEGLVASWDYASAHLLDSLNGHGGGYSNKEGTNDELQETGQVLADIFFDNYDSTMFSKKQRTEMVKSISDVLATKKITQTEKVTQLQKKSDEGNKEAQRELKTLKVLNETIKKKEPKNVIELNNIVQGDIKKVFNINNKENGNRADLIPKTYELYQNYPNPFNPSTKIAFDLPQDGKVKLVIYDILGRQIKTLVDNELRTAGKYTIEFNGSNLASGVYFYRLQVEGVSKFTAVKKMVLIK